MGGGIIWYNSGISFTNVEFEQTVTPTGLIVNYYNPKFDYIVALIIKAIFIGK